MILLSRSLRAVYRDVDDDARMQAWKHAMLNVSFIYKVASNDEVWWLAMNNRQKKKKHGMTMTMTCLQKIFSVLNHKSRYERSHGEVSAPSEIDVASPRAQVARL